MKVRITQSFVEAHSEALRKNAVLDVPESIARGWINLNRAVSLETAPEPEKSVNPKAEHRETATRRRS
jgi:hypothetical protein